MTKQNNDNQELIHKNVAFYQTFLNAWVGSRMEKDKQILTLSALAIGLLMAMRGDVSDVLAFLIWLFAGGAFVISMLIILIIFRQNSDYIEQIIRDDDTEKKLSIEKSLNRKTVLSFWCFLAGVILTISLAVYSSGFVIAKEDNVVTDKKIKLEEGLGGASKLAPSAPLKKGLEGADNLKPSSKNGGSSSSGSGSKGSGSTGNKSTSSAKE